MISRIIAKNFQSWENLDFEIKEGTTLISGLNSDDNTNEGSGKSAIFNSILWCLYGCLDKEVGIDEVIRHGEKSCSVELELSNGDRIVRTRKPNDLYIYSKAKDDKIRGTNAVETTKMIQAIIGLSYEAFLQAVYSSQNSYKKFLLANTNEKAGILSEIQDLSVFDKARKEAANRVKTLELEEFSLTKELSHLEQTLKALKQKEAEFLSLKAEALSKQQQKISNLEKQKVALFEQVTLKEKEYSELPQESELETIKLALKEESQQLVETRSSIKVEINKLDDKKADRKTLQKKLELGLAKLEQLELEPDKIATLKKNIKSKLVENAAQLKEAKAQLKIAEQALKNPEKSNCPTCGNKWEGDISHYEKEVVKAEKQVNALVESKETLTKYLQNTEDSETKLELEKSELIAAITKLSEDLEALPEITEETALELNYSLKAVSERLEAIEADQKLIESTLKEIALTCAVIKQTKANLTALELELEAESKQDHSSIEIKLHEVDRDYTLESRKAEYRMLGLEDIKAQKAKLEVLKSGFKEVKSFVFQGLLKELNRRVNNYLSELFEIPCRIRFHNEGEDGEISKIHTEISLDGVQRGLGSLSGGQAKRVSLAVDFALSDIINERGSNPLNLMLIDEGFGGLSENSKLKVLNLLKKRKGSILLVEHDSIFEQAFEQKFVCEFKDGISTRVS